MPTTIRHDTRRTSGGIHVSFENNVGAPARTETAVHLAAVNLRKNYRKGPHEIPVLQGVDLELYTGEFLAIVGQSGSGKSTLLHILGTLDVPTEGEVRFL